MCVESAGALTIRCATYLFELTASARASITEGLAFNTMQRVYDLHQRYMKAEEESGSSPAPSQADLITPGEISTSHTILKAAIWVTMSLAAGMDQPMIMSRLLEEVLRRDEEHTSKLRNATVVGSRGSAEREDEGWILADGKLESEE